MHWSRRHTQQQLVWHAQVKLSGAVHKSVIEVNEEGSVAAAATALIGFRLAGSVGDGDRTHHLYTFTKNIAKDAVA